MQIVELDDCSMVIMKDSEDPPWVSVGDIYRKATRKDQKRKIRVYVQTLQDGYMCEVSSDYIYTAGRLVLFFKDKIHPEFKLHSIVELEVSL